MMVVELSVHMWQKKWFFKTIMSHVLIKYILISQIILSIFPEFKSPFYFLWLILLFSFNSINISTTLSLEIFVMLYTWMLRAQQRAKIIFPYPVVPKLFNELSRIHAYTHTLNMKPVSRHFSCLMYVCMSEMSLRSFNTTRNFRMIAENNVNQSISVK